MIRNRYNYLTPSVPRHRREGKIQRTISFPKNWPNGYPKQTFHQHIHANIYNDRNSKHRRNTALGRSVKKYWGSWALIQLYVATTLALSSAVVYTRQLFSPRKGLISNPSVQHLRENKSLTNTEMMEQR